ncbi:hypothetical protein HDV00_010318 [Rhizophlyctis rosea]|nr:hypothetical protein HDV00_010318 [Rhizophlyctis rosea]
MEMREFVRLGDEGVLQGEGDVDDEGKRVGISFVGDAVEDAVNGEAEAGGAEASGTFMRLEFTDVEEFQAGFFVSFDTSEVEELVLGAGLVAFRFSERFDGEVFGVLPGVDGGLFIAAGSGFSAVDLAELAIEPDFHARSPLLSSLSTSAVSPAATVSLGNETATIAPSALPPTPTPLAGFPFAFLFPGMKERLGGWIQRNMVFYKRNIYTAMRKSQQSKNPFIIRAGAGQ